MADEVFAAIALIVGGFVAVSTYRWASKKKTKNQKFLEAAKKAGRCVRGVYESSKVLPGNPDSNNPRFRDDSLQVKYRYTVEGMTYFKTIIFQTQGVIGSNFPDQVDVYYDAANPRKAVCPEEASTSQQMQSGCLTTIVITFLAMFATFHIVRFLLG